MSTSNICVFHKAAMLVVFSKDGPNTISIRQALIHHGMSEDEAKANKNRMKVRKEKQIIEGRIAGGGSPVPTGVQFSTLSSPVSQITETVTTTTTTTTTATATTATTGEENDTVSVTTEKNKKKQIRRSSNQLYAEKGQKCVQQKKEDIAFIEAATKYEAEKKKKGSNKRSAATIVDEVNKKHKTNINERTVRTHVAKGWKKPPRRSGGKQKVPIEVRNALLSILKTVINLECAGMKQQPDRPKLIKMLAACLKKSDTFTYKSVEKLYDRLAQSIADDISPSIHQKKVEQRRLLWTTYNKINMWFESFKKQLIDLGFARAATDDDGDVGELVFLPGQLERVLNLDESEVTTDGTSKWTGGRPTTKMSSTDEKSTQGATEAHKSSYSATFIGGSNMAGWPIPPHFQLVSEAKDENARLDTVFLKHMKDVRGVFGGKEIKERGGTIGSNPKGGMDSNEFEKYLRTNIVPLYPDARDVKGLRVIILVDSGPGRGFEEMLAKLRVLGFYIIVGVPNTTHVTQPTDQNYGMFKSIYRKNMMKLTTIKGIAPNDIPLLIFGGVGTNEQSNKSIELEDAFQAAFGYEKNKQVWKKLGFSPFTRSCLEDTKVKHELIIRADGTIDETADPNTFVMLALEEENKAAVATLNSFGLDGSVCERKAPRLKENNIPVTVAGSRERQNLIVNAHSAGRRFLLTKGEAVNSDDTFIGLQRRRNEEQLVVLTKKKSKYDDYTAISNKAKTLIEHKEGKNINVFTQNFVTHPLLITVDELKILIEYKSGKNAPSKENKPALITRWNNVKDNDSNDLTREGIVLPQWTLEDVNETTKCTNENLTLFDTEVGKQACTYVQSAAAGFRQLPLDKVAEACTKDDIELLRSVVAASDAAVPTDNNTIHQMEQV